MTFTLLVLSWITKHTLNYSVALFRSASVSISDLEIRVNIEYVKFRPKKTKPWKSNLAVSSDNLGAM